MNPVHLRQFRSGKPLPVIAPKPERGTTRETEGDVHATIVVKIKHSQTNRQTISVISKIMVKEFPFSWVFKCFRHSPYNQINRTIVVIGGTNCTCAYPWASQSCLISDVGKRPIPIVPKHDVLWAGHLRGIAGRI